MKKAIFIMTMAVIATATSTYAQTNDCVKDSKAQAMQLEAEGWKSDTSHTIEYELIQYDKYRVSGDYSTHVGTTPQPMSNSAAAKNLAKFQAMLDAVNVVEHEFQAISQYMEGLIEESEIGAYVTTGVDRFKARISGDFYTQFAIYRQKNGKYEYRVFCYMDKHALETMCYDIFEELVVEYKGKDVAAKVQQLRNLK
jgi:hypothetical protein